VNSLSHYLSQNIWQKISIAACNYTLLNNATVWMSSTSTDELEVFTDREEELIEYVWAAGEIA
jgi:hypothetical protein